MKIRQDDKVMIISGKYKGKIGKVLKVLTDNKKVVVEGANMVKRHVKPGVISKEGGILSIEKPLDVSNVMYYEEKTKKPTRLGFKIEGGKKLRFSKKSGELIDKK